MAIALMVIIILLTSVMELRQLRAELQATQTNSFIQIYRRNFHHVNDRKLHCGSETGPKC
jgi:hypothetical protein